MTAQLQASPISVDDLLHQMTLDEKLAQLGGVWVTDLIDSQRTFDPGKAQPLIQHGIGHLTRVSGASLLKPAESASLANSIQRFLVEQTRLGIPAIVHEESCAGFMARDATTFPQAIGMAATWEPNLIEAMSQIICTQMRAVGAHHALAPVLDVCRDPRWGRIEETFGEDPYLIARIGTAYIRGLQGDDLRQGIIATGKHFIGYGMSEGGMNWSPAHISERELREIYLYPFMAAIREGRIASIMNAYHELDGVPLGSSQELMVDLLREALGFQGVVVSDYFTIDMLLKYHHLTSDAATAARLALEAGIDVELPKLNYYGTPLRDAVQSGQIEMALIDTSVRRVLQQKWDLGLFENPYVAADHAIEVFNTPEQRQLSQQIAEKSLVLLKNAGDLLPLSPDLKAIAVIGPGADSIRLLQGDYHYPTHLEGTFFQITNADDPNPEQDLSRANIQEHFIESVSILEGIRAAVSPETQVFHAPGCTIREPDTSGFEAAVAAAQQADVAVVVVGEMSGLGAHCTTGESLDRADLGLMGVQQQLVEAIHATGTPVIVVLLNGRPLALPWIAEHIPAIMEAWLPAQEGGTAIANVLFGKVNPGGKLPVSIPRHVGQVPVYYNHKPSGGRTHWQGNYVDQLTTPLYPFGYGLSYTQFEYRHLRLSAAQVSVHEVIQISLELENIGSYVGDEVVQLYVHDVVASVTRPVKALKGFQRITLQPGEKRQITFDLDMRHLAFYDRQMQYVVEPGEIEVLIGSSSEDIRLRGTFEIRGEVTPVTPVFLTPVTIH